MNKIKDYLKLGAVVGTLVAANVSAKQNKLDANAEKIYQHVRSDSSSIVYNDSSYGCKTRTFDILVDNSGLFIRTNKGTGDFLLYDSKRDGLGNIETIVAIRNTKKLSSFEEAYLSSTVLEDFNEISSPFQGMNGDIEATKLLGVKNRLRFTIQDTNSFFFNYETDEISELSPIYKKEMQENYSRCISTVLKELKK